MVDLAGEYDENATPDAGKEVIPAGTYKARIISAKKEDISRARSLGECLVLTWQVSDGYYQDALFWQRLNLWWSGPEKNPGKVKKIANSQFASVRQAVGVGNPEVADELLHRDCLVTVKIKKSEEYGDSNEVTKVKALDASSGGASASAPARPSGNPFKKAQAAA